MCSPYDQAREICKKIIKNNISTDKYLSIKDFMEYIDYMDRSSCLKFFHYWEFLFL